MISTMKNELTTPLRCLLASALTLCAMVAAAQTAPPFPSKPVRIIVPATAGDGSDILARTVGQELASLLGQSVLIENRPGAGGSVAADAVAKATPDGYTLMLANGSSHGVTPSLYPRLPYDSIRDFATVTLIGTAPNALVVSSTLPVNTFAEFVTYVRARPGRLNIASAGNGSLSHLAGEWLKSASKLDMVHVPYRGATPALTDLTSGQVAAMVINIPTIQPLLRAGKLKVLATSGARRAGSLPDAPTLAESGLTGYESLAWFGLIAPAKTPPEVINRLATDAQRAIAAPAVRERLAAFGADPVGSSPAEFGSFMRSEIAKYAKIIRDANVRID